MLKDKLYPKRPPLIIGVDGPNGSGKTTLAGWIAWQFGTATINLDEFATYSSTVPIPWDIGALSKVLFKRVFEHRQPIVVEGILLKEALRHVGQKPDMHIWIDLPEDLRIESRLYRRCVVPYIEHYQPKDTADFIFTSLAD
jgi:uridine kinase